MLLDGYEVHFVYCRYRRRQAIYATQYDSLYATQKLVEVTIPNMADVRTLRIAVLGAGPLQPSSAQLGPFPSLASRLELT